MSYRECIQVFHPVDIQKYLAVLQTEFEARPHPQEPGAFLIDTPPLPFRQPRIIEEHLSILSFNYLPLSANLIWALINHPELALATTIVLWTAEQDLVIKGALESLKQQLGK